MEVLVAMTLIVILAAIGVISLRAFFFRTDETVMTQQLLRVIEFAQQEAKARHQAIIVCGSKDLNTCSSAWSEGQLVFADVNDDGVVSDKSQILAVLQAKTHSGVLHWRAFPYYHDYIAFYPSGLMRSDNASFWYCSEDGGKPVWAIMLSKTGKARLESPYEGSDLTCAGLSS